MNWDDRERPSHCEIRVLRAVAEHGTIAAAAAALSLSPHTVDFHLDSLRGALGFRHLPQLIAWAAQQGWLEQLELAPLKTARTG